MKSYVRNAVIGLAAVVLGACGGGSEGDTAATSFAAAVDGSDAFVGVVVDQTDDRVLAYVCDGKSIATWFTGAPADDGTLALTAADGARLTGRITGGELSGTVTFPGDASPHTFKAPSVSPPAGLYRQLGEVNGRSALGGWIVLGDGSERGGVRTSTGFTNSETGLSKPSKPVTSFTDVDPSPSGQKAAFIAEGERVCGELKARLDAIFLDFAPTLPKRAAAYSEVVPLGRDFAQRFGALQVPEDDRARIEASLLNYRLGLDQLEEGVQAAKDGDLVRSNGAFDAAFQSFAKSDDELRSYGFTVCAEAKTTRGVPMLSEAERQALREDRTEFIAQADAICDEGNQRLKPFEDEAFSQGIPDLATWRVFLEAALPNFQDLLGRLRTLSPPPGDQGIISAMLDDYERALSSARRAADAAQDGDQSGFDAAIEEATQFAKRGDDQSTRYGFRKCREA